MRSVRTAQPQIVVERANNKAPPKVEQRQLSMLVHGKVFIVLTTLVEKHPVLKRSEEEDCSEVFVFSPISETIPSRPMSIRKYVGG